MFKRLIRALPVIAITAGIMIGGTAIAAHASVGAGEQFDANGGGSYPNAWGGNVVGHFIKTNYGQTANNDFVLYSVGSGNYELFSSPLGVQHTNCISDNANNSGDAKAGLNNCVNGTPWGALFTFTSCTESGQAGVYLRNNHWGGYLAAGGNQGDQIYLNFVTGACLVLENAY